MGLAADHLAGRRDRAAPRARRAGARADASSRDDLRGRLAGLSMPVHVISGEHDILVPRWKQEELAAEIPGARLTVIEGGSHALQLEKAQEFSAAVLDFIADAAVSA
jgi:pimeloyl-ACP methyl ester carboxylesterase